MDLRYEEAISFNGLYEAFRFTKRGSYWKDSTINYDINRLYNSVKISRSLKNRKYRLKGYYKFSVQEREKVRDIQSLHITDRVVQRSFCDHVLLEDIQKSFVYDNSASQKGKGTRFSRNRLKTHLQKYYRKHGIEGYVLQIDVRKYFDNLSHDYLKERMTHYFSDNPQLLKELHRIIDSFSGDKGIGLGSQICQIFALDYLNTFDHFVKEVLGIKYYGRYMDDMYLIHEDKNYLKLCLELIKCFLGEVGLETHPNKTHIFPLRNGIKFLGFHFYLTNTGGIYIKLNKVSVKRVKRRIRKMIKIGVSEDQIRKSFTSWKAHAMYGDSYYLVKNVEAYMNKLLEGRSESNE